MRQRTCSQAGVQTPASLDLDLLREIRNRFWVRLVDEQTLLTIHATVVLRNGIHFLRVFRRTRGRLPRFRDPLPPTRFNINRPLNLVTDPTFQPILVFDASHIEERRTRHRSPPPILLGGLLRSLVSGANLDRVRGPDFMPALLARANQCRLARGVAADGLIETARLETDVARLFDVAAQRVGWTTPIRPYALLMGVASHVGEHAVRVDGRWFSVRNPVARFGRTTEGPFAIVATVADASGNLLSAYAHPFSHLGVLVDSRLEDIVLHSLVAIIRELPPRDRSRMEIQKPVFPMFDHVTPDFVITSPMCQTPFLIECLGTDHSAYLATKFRQVETLARDGHTLHLLRGYDRRLRHTDVRQIRREINRWVHHGRSLPHVRS